MADTEGLGDFFVYVFIVYPVTGWLLRPKRFSKFTGLTLAIGFLALVAIVKTQLEWAERGPNFYRLLGVDRFSSSSELKAAYKAQALALHPDKNPSEDASAMFDSVRTAFDVLSDDDKRDMWDRYGPEKALKQAVVEDSQVFFEMLVFHAAWAMLAFVLTAGRANGEARSIVYVGQVFMFTCEVYFTLQDGTELPLWIPSSMAKHEVVALMRSLFPAFLNGCRCVCSSFYVDIDERNRLLFLALDQQNKDTLLVLRNIQVAMSNMQQGKGSAIAVTATGKLRELEENVHVSDIGEELKKEKKSNPLWGVVGFFVIYFGLQYLFSGAGGNAPQQA